MNKFKEWFDVFYDSKEAQEFCFGNYNNATRDEQVGEFSAKAAYNHQQLKIDKLEKENKELKAELEQQRFNNKHNLSIDQKVADRIKELEKSNETLNKRCADLEKIGNK